MSYAEVLTTPTTKQAPRDIVIDCDVKKIMYGAFLAEVNVNTRTGKTTDIGSLISWWKREYSRVFPTPKRR